MIGGQVTHAPPVISNVTVPVLDHRCRFYNNFIVFSMGLYLIFLIIPFMYYFVYAFYGRIF